MKLEAILENVRELKNSNSMEEEKVGQFNCRSEANENMIDLMRMCPEFEYRVSTTVNGSAIHAKRRLSSFMKVA